MATSDDGESYRTIKELVLSEYRKCGGMPRYDDLTALVHEHFPDSKWGPKHYAWYKSMIKTGKMSVDMPSKSEPEPTDTAIEESVTQSIDTQVSLERDLQQYFESRVDQIELGLTLFPGGVEYATDAGRIDLLCNDGDGFCVVELKAGKAKDAALGQLLGYIGCLSDEHENVRGILIAADFSVRVVHAAKSLRNIKLIRYELSFRLRDIGR